MGSVFSEIWEISICDPEAPWEGTDHLFFTEAEALRIVPKGYSYELYRCIVRNIDDTITQKHLTTIGRG